MKNITIAIDGHSSTGKSTLAKELAKHLGYVYVDSGAMYRCVALFAINNGLYRPSLDQQKLIEAIEAINISFQLDKESGMNRTFLNGKDVEDEIRMMRVSNKVSEVAAIPEVRKHLVKIQKALGKDKGVVMDGRDIGTVVFPDAELKIFMTASASVRAQRRFSELLEKGVDVTFEAVLENISNRDLADSTRADSPLLKASDARVLDNSLLGKEEQFKTAVSWAEEATNK